MDPLRGVIHLGLKLTEATLDRALDVVKLADTLIVASAVPPVREPSSDEPTWPEEEQADLDALSATLRARKDSGSTPAQRAAARRATSSAKKSSTAKKTSTAKKASAAKKAATAKGGAAKKTSSAKTAPVKKSAARAPAKTTPAKKATATKASTAKKAPAKKTSTGRKSTAKKTSTGRKSTAKKATPPVVAAETPTLVALPDE